MEYQALASFDFDYMMVILCYECTMIFIAMGFIWSLKVKYIQGDCHTTWYVNIDPGNGCYKEPSFTTEWGVTKGQKVTS